MLRDISPANTNTLFICNTKQHHSTYEGDRTLLSTMHSINKCYYHRLTIPHSCEVTGTNNCITYIRHGPNNHDLKTTYTRTTPSTHCRTLASEGAIGRLARSPTDDVLDVLTPHAQLSEKHEYITNYTPTTPIFRCLFRTWWQFNTRNTAPDIPNLIDYSD